MPERKDHRSDVFVRCKTLCSLLLAASCSRACPKCSHVSESIRRPDVWSNDAKSKKGRVNGKDFTFSLAGSTKKPSKARRKSAKWLHDSGSTVHCINDKSLFYSIEDRNPGISLTVANNKQVGIEAIGSVLLQVRNQHGVLEQHLLQNVCYCPSFGRNILSVSRLWHENRLKTKFGGKCYLQSQSGSKYFLSSNDSPYGLQTDVLSGEFVFSTKQNIPSDSDLWHRRFMHSGEAKIKLLAKVLKQFTNYTFDSKSCDACQQGGAIRQPFGDGRAHRRKAKPDTSKRRKFYTYFGERISTDLCGPFHESLVGKCKYAIVFHDAYSRRIKIYALESKSKEDVLAAFQMFLDDHKHLLSRGVKEFHSDNGSEYINSNMDEFCEELCVRRSFTVPYTPQQNPHAERTWGSLLRKVRTSLVASGLPEHFWNFAILQAELIHNILPRSSEVASPFEITGESFDYSKLHCFGCKCYYFLPDRERSSKLSPRAVPAVYLGEDPERRGHLVYVPSLEWVTTSYHLVFSELEYLSQEDLDGATRFKVPTSKRVTFRTPYDGPQQYTERRDSKSTVIDEPSSHSQSFDEQQDGDAESDDTLPNQCSTTNCTYPAGHHGLCSTQLVDNNTPGPPSRRLRTRHTVNVCTTCRDGRCVFSVDPRQLCTHSDVGLYPVMMDHILTNSLTMKFYFYPIQVARYECDLAHQCLKFWRSIYLMANYQFPSIMPMPSRGFTKKNGSPQCSRKLQIWPSMEPGNMSQDLHSQEAENPSSPDGYTPSSITEMVPLNVTSPDLLHVDILKLKAKTSLEPSQLLYGQLVSELCWLYHQVSNSSWSILMLPAHLLKLTLMTSTYGWNHQKDLTSKETSTELLCVSSRKHCMAQNKPHECGNKLWQDSCVVKRWDFNDLPQTHAYSFTKVKPMAYLFWVSMLTTSSWRTTAKDSTGLLVSLLNISDPNTLVNYTGFLELALINPTTHMPSASIKKGTFSIWLTSTYLVVETTPYCEFIPVVRSMPNFAKLQLTMNVTPQVVFLTAIWWELYYIWPSCLNHTFLTTLPCLRNLCQIPRLKPTSWLYHYYCMLPMNLDYQLTTMVPHHYPSSKERMEAIHLRNITGPSRQMVVSSPTQTVLGESRTILTLCLVSVFTCLVVSCHLRANSSRLYASRPVKLSTPHALTVAKKFLSFVTFVRTWDLFCMVHCCLVSITPPLWMSQQIKELQLVPNTLIRPFTIFGINHYTSVWLENIFSLCINALMALPKVLTALNIFNGLKRCTTYVLTLSTQDSTNEFIVDSVASHTTVDTYSNIIAILEDQSHWFEPWQHELDLNEHNYFDVEQTADDLFASNMFESTRLRGGGPKRPAPHDRTGWNGMAALLTASKRSTQRDAQIDTLRGGDDVVEDVEQTTADLQQQLEECIVCMDQIKTCRLVPLNEVAAKDECFHGFCEPCVQRMFAESLVWSIDELTGRQVRHKFPLCCPLCNKPARDYLRVPGPFDPNIWK
jgi:transposase InsO family protein